MKTRAVFLLLAAGLLALAAWLVHTPTHTQADEIPEQYRSTVLKARNYLLKAQHKDGYWEGNEGQHPVAMTGLVGLALLMGEARPEPAGINKTREYTSIRKAVDWLIASGKPDRDGLLFSGHASETSRYMEGHGLATLFLCGACELEQDGKRREKMNMVLGRAVQYIVKAQSTQGGWYHTSKVEGHDLDSVLPTVIQMQALQAAQHVGISVRSEVIGGARDYLKKRAAARPAADSRLLDTAATLAVYLKQSFENLGSSPPRSSFQDDVGRQWFKHCQAELPVGGKMKLGKHDLAHYYYAQVQFSLNDGWSAYRKTMFDHLQEMQNKDGSWPTSEGISVGAVYATALWCTVLQLDNRSHPSLPRIVPGFTT